MRLKRSLYWLACLPLLAGCVNESPLLNKPSSELLPPNKSSGTHLFLCASHTLNPDGKGQPSPVELWLFELKTPGRFERATFFELYGDQATNTLSDSTLGRSYFNMRPGEELQVNRSLNPSTKQIGVVVYYRDVEHSQWRALQEVIPNGSIPIHIVVGANQVQITPDATPQDRLSCQETSTATAASSGEGPKRHANS